MAQKSASLPRSDELNDRALPQDYFDELNKRFNFTVDAAASPANAKLPRFFSRQDCGLSRSWCGERVYCNPPYSNIEPWIIKAWQEIRDIRGWAELIVMLLPANRTEQGWWQRHVEPFRDQGGILRTEFLPGRLRFLKPGQTTQTKDAFFGSVLLIFEKSKHSLSHASGTPTTTV